MEKPILVIIKNSIALQPGLLEFFCSQIIIKSVIHNNNNKKVEKGEGNLSELYEKLFQSVFPLRKGCLSSELLVTPHSPLPFCVFIERILLWVFVMWDLRKPGLISPLFCKTGCERSGFTQDTPLASYFSAL